MIEGVTLSTYDYTEVSKKIPQKGNLHEFKEEDFPLQFSEFTGDDTAIAILEDTEVKLIPVSTKSMSSTHIKPTRDALTVYYSANPETKEVLVDMVKGRVVYDFTKNKIVEGFRTLPPKSNSLFIVAGRTGLGKNYGIDGINGLLFIKSNSISLLAPKEKMTVTGCEFVIMLYKEYFNLPHISSRFLGESALSIPRPKSLRTRYPKESLVALNKFATKKMHQKGVTTTSNKELDNDEYALCLTDLIGISPKELLVNSYEQVEVVNDTDIDLGRIFIQGGYIIVECYDLEMSQYELAEALTLPEDRIILTYPGEKSYDVSS